MTTMSQPNAVSRAAVLTALKDRRTCRVYDGRPVSKAIVESMLEAARWAPNHRLTNPWRFIVVEKGGAARRKVADMVYDWTYENVKNPTEERRVQSAQAAKQEILDAPALIYVYTAPGRDAEETEENYAAACCAIQNMQLAAYANGVAIGWSTGKPLKPAGITATVGAKPEWRAVGALFCGYPAQHMDQQRKPVSEVTTWV
jgi:nitroreductase